MSTFDPGVALAALAATKPVSEQKRYKLNWNREVNERIQNWKDNRPRQSQNEAQLRWAAHVIQYVSEVYKTTRVHGKAKSIPKSTPTPLSMSVPLYGPRFQPPTYLDCLKRSGAPEITPEIMYIKPLTVIHPFYFPELSKCPQCNSSDIKWHSWVATGYRDVHGIDYDELAIGYQLHCVSCQESRAKTGGDGNDIQTCFATTSVEFWERYTEWDIPRGIPHFTRRCAVTRGLYKLIIELRLTSTASGIEEHIKQLHLCEYNDHKLDYLRTIKQRLGGNLLIPVRLLQFSEPTDEAGYNDHPITHDMISDVYATFSTHRRQAESEDYMKTLTAVVLSCDQTYNTAKKATVKSKEKNAKHDTPMKGGVLSVINELNEIIAWRFCQTQSTTEISELLQGYVTRSELLQAALAIIIMTDNCCHSRSAIRAVLPNVEVVLDVFHFKQRYAAVILNGVKNARYKEVLRDIVEAIIRRRAEKGRPAEYWGLEEQIRRLETAYETWLKHGGIWSAAAPKVHADQMRHVRKGCLVRSVQDVATDGSRIEGSHKHWNSIMRSYASGLENMLYLCRDFVHRRNIRVANRNEANRTARPLAASGFGSHHTSFIDFINRLWNELVSNGKGIPAGATYTLAPVLQDVPSNETFGVVSSATASTFGGLFEIKEEDDDLLDSMRLHDSDEISASDEILREMNIDPNLRHQPLASTCTPSAKASTSLAHLNLRTTNLPDRAPNVKASSSDDSTGNVIDLSQDEDEVVPVLEATVTAATCTDVESAIVPLAEPSVLLAAVEEGETGAEGVAKRTTINNRVTETAQKRKVEILDGHREEDSGPERKRIRIAGIAPRACSKLESDTAEVATGRAEGLDRFFTKYRRDARLGLQTAEANHSAESSTAAANPSTVIGTVQREDHIHTLMQKLPRAKDSSLTPSQALFSKLTELDVRALRIDRGEEFFLFMDLRAAEQWASFKMTAYKWVTATEIYNKKWSEACRKRGMQAIQKNPRALVAALGDVEQQVLSRIYRGDYKSKSSGDQPSRFWLKHCFAVPLGKDMKDAQDSVVLKSRQPLRCRRCKTLMYPNGKNGEGNHKRGVCSDGGPANMKSDTPPAWPQPPGILNAESSEFGVVAFLLSVQDLYQKMIVEQVSRSDLSMEMEAFAAMLMARTEYDKLDRGMIIFRLLEGFTLQSTISVDQYLVEFGGKQYLRLDCLAGN